MGPDKGKEETACAKTEIILSLQSVFFSFHSDWVQKTRNIFPLLRRKLSGPEHSY